MTQTMVACTGTRDMAKFKIRILFEWDGVYDGVYDPTHLRAAVMT